MLDENITWKDHLRIIEKKIAKSLGLLYRAKQFLNEDSRKIIYFSYIHSYLNPYLNSYSYLLFLIYGNVAWTSAYYTKLKTMHYQ